MEQEPERSLIGPIKVSGSNGSDVQGFVEPLKDEGPIAMARDERVGGARRNAIRDRR